MTEEGTAVLEFNPPSLQETVPFFRLFTFSNECFCIQIGSVIFQEARKLFFHPQGSSDVRSCLTSLSHNRNKWAY
jgi:hypothetical protein